MKFFGLSEIIECEMTRLRDLILEVFWKDLYTRATLRKNNTGFSNFKIHSTSHSCSKISILYGKSICRS